MMKKSSAKESLHLNSCMEDASRIDDTSDERSTHDRFPTFEVPKAFGSEFMPFLSIVGERFDEKPGYLDYLENLQVKTENENVRSTSFPRRNFE